MMQKNCSCIFLLMYLSNLKGVLGCLKYQVLTRKEFI